MEELLRVTAEVFLIGLSVPIWLLLAGGILSVFGKTQYATAPGGVLAMVGVVITMFLLASILVGMGLIVR